MLGGGATVLAAVLLIQAETQFDVGGRVESQVGTAPTGVTTNAANQSVPAQQGQVLLSATPALSLRYLSETDDLRATSYTRALWRPAPLWRQRPIFLETLEVSEVGTPTRRTLWRLNLRGSYGEEDYTMLSQQFLSQPAIPTALTALMLNAQGELIWRATRRTDLTLRTQAIYRRTITNPSVLDTTDQTGAPPTVQPTLVPPGAQQRSTLFAFPPQLTVEVAPGFRHLLSRRSILEAFVGLMDSDIGDMPPVARLNVFSVQPEIGLTYRLSTSNQVHAAAGASYAVALVRSPNAPSWPPLLPLFQLDLTSYLRRAREMQWRSFLGVMTNAFTDPVLGTEVLRGTAQARIDLDIGPNWGVGALALFSTDINGPVRLPGQGPDSIPIDETVASAEIPLFYRKPNAYMVQLGGRFTQRAPHLRSPQFAWRSNDREMWVFLSFTTLTAQVPRRTRAAVMNRTNGHPDQQPATGDTLPPPLPPPVQSPL